jgi:hypothetical protein
VNGTNSTTAGQNQVTAPVVEATVRNINEALHPPQEQGAKKRGQRVQGEAIDYMLRHLYDAGTPPEGPRIGAAHQLEHFATTVLHQVFNNRRKHCQRL